VTILLPIFFYHNTAQFLPRLDLGRVVTPQVTYLRIFPPTYLEAPWLSLPPVA